MPRLKATAGPEVLATTRELALQEAGRLFVERGFFQAPLSELAARLNISKAALYYYFDSKDHILMALISPLLDRIDALFDEAPSFISGLPGRQLLLSRYAETLVSDPRASALLGQDVNVSQHPDIAPRIEEHVSRLAHLLAGPRPSQDSMIRAHVAMIIVTRGLSDLRENNPALAKVSRRKYRRILVELASDVLPGRREHPGPDR